MTVQNRKVSTVFRSQTREEILPLDNDSKKDLESHRVVDLLPDRQAETAARWMRHQPDLAVISRDRGGEYASVQIEGESCRFRNKYLPLFGSYCEKISSRDHST